jgi:mRNA-degrading endonuclease YafQ of YafQ-DinJ toxin-antitoxin module
MDKQLLKVYEDIALSDSDLMKLVDNKANLVLYPELVDYNNIDDVLGKYRACVLLFEAKPGYGHWVCLFRNGNLIEFFNPYGGYPDDSLDFIPMHFRKVSNQLEPYLSMLLMHSPYELSYNEHAFQHHGKNIKTCGRHCAMRLIFRDLDLDSYTDMIEDLCEDLDTDADGVVSMMTASRSQVPTKH